MATVTFTALLQASIFASGAGADTYAEAYRIATETGRPMVVFVTADWCGACQTMKRNVFPQIRKRGLLGRVAFAVVNLDRERKLGRKLTRGGPIPQTLMFRRTSEGWRLSRLTGSQSVGKVEAFIDRGLQRDAAARKIKMAQTGQSREGTSETMGSKSG